MIRRLVLLVIWVCLLVSVPLLRSHRFEEDRVFAPLTLDALRFYNSDLPAGSSWTEVNGRTALRVEKIAGLGYQSFPLRIPNVTQVRACHVVVSLCANGLKVGQNSWDTGRVMMFWKDHASQHAQEFDMIAGVENDDELVSLSQVVRPASGLAEPDLRIEHLGNAGSFTVTRLEIQPVQERRSWFIFRWLVVLLWIGGITLHLQWVWRGRTWRNVAAASLWIFCASLVSFPGPWKSVRPCFIPFNIGPAADSITHAPSVSDSTVGVLPKQTFDAQQHPDSPVKTPNSSHPNRIRKIPPQDTWMMAAKAALADYRWVIHVMMLTCPCVLWIMLVGRRAAFALGLSFAVSMELAQVSFGFGFDVKDVFDLISNTAGLLIAISLVSWGLRTRCLGSLCRRLMPASET